MRKTNQNTRIEIPIPDLPGVPAGEEAGAEHHECRKNSGLITGITGRRGMQPAETKPFRPRPKEGSPIKKACANIALSGTTDEQSTATVIKSTGNERASGGPSSPGAKQTSRELSGCAFGQGASPATITTGPVPFYLVVPTLSSEIHKHGGAISRIAIWRTNHHAYMITLTKTSSEVHGQGHTKSPNQTQPIGGQHAE